MAPGPAGQAVYQGRQGVASVRDALNGDDSVAGKTVGVAPLTGKHGGFVAFVVA
jgi:hypothetical protein